MTTNPENIKALVREISRLFHAWRDVPTHRVDEQVQIHDRMMSKMKEYWPEIEAALTEQAQEIEALQKENNTLRGLLGNSAKPCPYCGLAAEDQGKCALGFPGCPRADDQQLSKHFADGYRADETEKENAALQAKIDTLMLKYCPQEMTPEQRAEWGDKGGDSGR